jgi:hypothetical protein
MKFWWLSFADPKRESGEQFLGAVISRAHSFPEAIQVAHVLGCNPGGECKGVEIPEEMGLKINKTHIERLLTIEECKEVDGMMGGEGKIRRA